MLDLHYSSSGQATEPDYVKGGKAIAVIVDSASIAHGDVSGVRPMKIRPAPDSEAIKTRVHLFDFTSILATNPATSSPFLFRFPRFRRSSTSSSSTPLSPLFLFFLPSSSSVCMPSVA